MKKIASFLNNHVYETIGVVTFICAVAFIMFTMYFCVHTINEAGGFRAVIVESGKEVKSIIKDINEK